MSFDLDLNGTKIQTLLDTSLDAFRPVKKRLFENSFSAGLLGSHQDSEKPKYLNMDDPAFCGIERG